MIWLFSGNF